MNRIARFTVVGLFGLFAAIMVLWAVGAIYYSNLPWHFLRVTAAILFPLVCVGIFIAIKPLCKAVFVFFAAFTVILMGWLLIPPSNERQWQTDVAMLSHADINGDEITIHHIRNFDYHSPDDYTPRYYDKTFSLSALKTADLYIVFWGPTLIAHTMMSFGFGDQGYICISIETRKEQDESYSAVKGFFKQFELIYIVADERDVVRLRTNYRGEDVYLYRLNANPALIHEVFLDYFKQINRLAQQPQWYNALAHNCTTTIRGHTAPYAHGKMSWKLLANGYLDTLLYERKAIDTTLPFEQMKAISRINDRAISLDADQDYSQQIREGLPGMGDIK
jgi:hypothetical protein